MPFPSVEQEEQAEKADGERRDRREIEPEQPEDPTGTCHPGPADPAEGDLGVPAALRASAIATIPSTAASGTATAT